VSQLTGPEQRVLVDILRVCLTEFSQLDRALRHGGLGGLSDYARDDTLPAMCSQAVDSLSRRYKIIEFTSAVLDGDVLNGSCPPLEKWVHENLVKLQNRIVNPQPPPGFVIDAAALGGRQRELYQAVTRFDEHIKDRQYLFRYLKANKTLHEVLHQLPDFQELLGSPIEEARRTKKVPRSAGIFVRQFAILVQEARDELPCVEFADEHVDWVEALEEIVAGLQTWCKDPSQDKCDSYLEYLNALPGQKQPALNFELAKIAKRLKTDALSESAQAVLKSLRHCQEDHAVDAAELEEFDRTCHHLKGLVADHDACQFGDTHLLVTVGRSHVAPAHIRQWPSLRAKLAEMAARNPDDERVRQVVASAAAFESATDAVGREAFNEFQEKFTSLFSEVDKELLEEATTLVEQAGRLGATLQGYLRGREVATT
jgi:hypothetical protein